MDPESSPISQQKQPTKHMSQVLIFLPKKAKALGWQGRIEDLSL